MRRVGWVHTGAAKIPAIEERINFWLGVKWGLLVVVAGRCSIVSWFRAPHAI